MTSAIFVFWRFNNKDINRCKNKEKIWEVICKKKKLQNRPIHTRMTQNKCQS